MSGLLQKLAFSLGIEIHRAGRGRHSPAHRRLQVISLKPDVGVPHCGNMLLSNTLGPFLLDEGKDITNRHTCDLECLEIAKAFLERGYCVDVVDFDNRVFKPEKNYSVFVGVLDGFGRLAPFLGLGCIKIYHAVFAHWLVNNSAQYRRLEALWYRRGVALPPVKLVRPHKSVELADYVTLLGNEFTATTYRYGEKPIYRVPITATHTYPFDDAKNFERCRKSFLWLGSKGLVHKGLDLVLEAFAQLPDYRLTVCGPVGEEVEFARAYHKELYESANIHTVGWVDVGGRQFAEIVGQCVGLIFASCSEGGGGAVVQGMHAGLIPVVSYESSVDIGDFGLLLKESSVEEIKRAVVTIAELPVEDLKSMSRGAWVYAREHHTRERFAKRYRETLDHIINGYQPADRAEG